MMGLFCQLQIWQDSDRPEMGPTMPFQHAFQVTEGVNGVNLVMGNGYPDLPRSTQIYRMKPGIGSTT